ncbi:MAG: bifunctional nuclease family protein [Flexilinea sp.]
MADMLEVIVDSLRVSLTSQQRVIVLKDAKNELYLPIWIGTFEAESIVVALQEIEVSRPQTHDLLKNVIQALGARLKQVELSKIQADTFYSFLILEVGDVEYRVDCRPSDAISLAIRCHVPIFVDTDVIIAAGIKPEKDIRHFPSVSEENYHDSGIEDEDEPSVEKNLSIFDDFLRKIDLGSPEDKPETDENDEKGDDKPKDDDQNDLLLPS